jgi:hypothetical protein
MFQSKCEISIRWVVEERTPKGTSKEKPEPALSKNEKSSRIQLPLVGEL